MFEYVKLLGVVLIIFTFISGNTLYAQQDIESQINAIENEMSQLRQNQYDLLAPNNFEDAVKEFQRAKNDFDEGKDIRGIRERLEKAGKYLKVVSDIGKQGEILFADVLQARQDALVVQAPNYALAEYEAAEEKFLDASRRLEKGDLKSARDRVLKTEEAYRMAELKAIKESIIGEVRNLLNQAEEKKVSNNAPITIGEARSLYDEVLTILNSNRYAKSNARETANEAAYQIKHAIYLSDVIEKFKKDDKNWEKMLRSFEGRLDNIAAGFDFKGRYDEGLANTENDIILAIKNLKEENKTLKEDLSNLQEQNEQLDQKIKKYEQTVVTELELKKAQEEKIKKIESIFTKDEAEVIISGDNLVIRLYALTFGSGSAAITPEHFILLTKVMRALREFPKMKYLIAGHTDSQGNDSYNLALSENRAAAVRAYLEANMGLKTNQFESIGYGESRPIASNKTMDGRRLNRRIEIIINLGS